MQRKSSDDRNQNDDLLDLVSNAVVDFHFWLFLAQAGAFGLLFLVWQVSELEQPWLHGPWHIVFVGWLVIYGCYLSYASRRREIMSAVTDARASKVSEADKLVAWYERMLLETRRPPWWLQVPLFVILMATWPLLVIIAAVRLSYRIAINPQSWPEAAAFIAAIIAILIVPTSGPGPLLVTGAHLAIVTWLRRNVKD